MLPSEEDETVSPIPVKPCLDLGITSYYTTPLSLEDLSNALLPALESKKEQKKSAFAMAPFEISYSPHCADSYRRLPSLYHSQYIFQMRGIQQSLRRFIAGNAIFTLLILTAVVGGAGFAIGKHRFKSPGPLQDDKVVNIPARLGIMDIGELLRTEGIIDEHPAIFVGGGVLALRARTDLKSGEYLFPKHSSVRDVVETMVEGKVVQHLVTLPEGLTSERSCGSQPAHESLFNRRLWSLPPAVCACLFNRASTAGRAASRSLAQPSAGRPRCPRRHGSP